MNKIEELKKIIEYIKHRARRDPEITDENYEALVVAAQGLIDALKKLEEARQIDEAYTKTLYEKAQRLSIMLDGLKRIQDQSKGKPSYIDDFVPSMTSSPYTMPKTLYEPQGTEQITINVSGQMYSERAELALSLLFPGSITYRYGSPPVKVFLGRWFQSSRAHLSTIHELFPKPGFELKEGNRLLRVYKPLTLRAFRLQNNQIPICVSCLSLADSDENCVHSTLQPRAKLPSNYPVVRKMELSRKEADKKALQIPMAFIVPEATYLPEIEVGIAIIGFERTATVRGNPRIVRVDYDPPIGIRLVTAGISFKVRIPSDFLKNIIYANPMLRRDTILQLLSNRIFEIMSEAGLPYYNHELILSSLIAALGLDEVIDEKIIEKRLREEDFVSNINEAINRELTFYEGVRPDQASVQSIIQSLRSFTITENDIILKLRNTILHSLAHVLLLATAITSGSQLDDLDYLIEPEREEVIIFDSVSGGNGSSETAFEFLSEPGKFTVEAYWQSEEREEAYRPRNLDETAFELLLPCINGVADRVFLFGKVLPFENEIKRKLNELQNKRSTHEVAIRRVREYGRSRLFPISIGYHAMDYSARQQDADRFKEIAGICLHGCPECIALGRKCNFGSFQEKYNISKFALDELVNYVLQKVTLTEPTIDDILRGLKDHGIVVIKSTCNDQEKCNEIVDQLNMLVMELSGREIDGGHIKFAGHWADTNSTFEGIDYYYMFRVI